MNLARGDCIVPWFNWKLDVHVEMTSHALRGARGDASKLVETYLIS